MKTYRCDFKILQPDGELIAKGELDCTAVNGLVAMKLVVEHLAKLGAYRSGEQIRINASEAQNSPETDQPDKQTVQEWAEKHLIDRSKLGRN